MLKMGGDTDHLGVGFDTVEKTLTVTVLRFLHRREPVRKHMHLEIVRVLGVLEELGQLAETRLHVTFPSSQLVEVGGHCLYLQVLRVHVEERYLFKELCLVSLE
jgi:predicted DNA-binding protein with PD1-like motif